MATGWGSADAELVHPLLLLEFWGFLFAWCEDWSRRETFLVDRARNGSSVQDGDVVFVLG